MGTAVLIVRKRKSQGCPVEWPDDEVIYNKWAELGFGTMAELGDFYGVTGSAIGRRLGEVLERRKLRVKN